MFSSRISAHNYIGFYQISDKRRDGWDVGQTIVCKQFTIAFLDRESAGLCILF